MSAPRRSKGPGPSASRTAPPPVRQPRAVWSAAAVLALGLAAYANALGHPFVMDDAGTVVDNPTIRSLGESLAGGPFQTATAGRPLVNLAFALNYAAGGASPWGYHAVNLALHLVAALLVLALLRLLFRLPLAADWTGSAGDGLALACTSLWVVHPLNSEVIGYVTQRTESMAAIAVLATCYGGLRSRTSPRPLAWQALAISSALAGVLCKESAVAGPLLLLLLESAFTRRSPLAVVRERPVFYGGLLASWVVLGGLIVDGPRWRSAGFSSGVSPWTYLLNQAPLIVRYLRLVVAPVGLVLDYGRPEPMALAAAMPPGLLVIALLVASAVALVRVPLLGVFGVWFFVTLAPTSSILPIATEVGAERRMYLPLIAVLAAVVLTAWRLVPAAWERRRALAGFTALACLVLGGLTIVRNTEYESDLRIWQTVVERWPSGRAHHNYGIVLKAAGRRDEAVAEYVKAVETLPEAEYALAFERQADNRHEEAITRYRTFIAARPDDINVPRAYHQMGRSLLALGRQEEAIAAFRDALARRTGDVDSLAGIGDILMARKAWADAIPIWRQYLALKPDNTGVLMNLGIALVQVDRFAEAGDLFRRVTQLTPGDVGAHVNYGYALSSTGRLAEAAREFQTAITLEKDPQGRAEIQAAAAEALRVPLPRN